MTYRQAIPDDTEAILVLNHKYYQAYLEGEKDKGFLKNEFSFEQIQTLIKQHEVVVAQMEENVIGYYLTNSIFETEAIKKRKTIVQELILKGKIKDAKYALLTQAVVDKPFMGKGVAKELLRKLKELVKPKFDFLIGYIDHENHNAKEAHLKSGWVIFTDIDNGWLAMTEVNEV
jgi:hypothetical protein